MFMEHHKYLFKYRFLKEVRESTVACLTCLLINENNLQTEMLEYNNESVADVWEIQ
jgi:hypothetical protein